MNRAEYANAVRDLLAIEVDTSDLPADDSAYGFDNVADALGVSPLLLESYMTTARKVSRLAIGNASPAPVTTTYKTPEDLTQDYAFAALPLGTRGGIRIDEYLPATGEYEIRVRLRRQPTGQIRGIGEEHRVELAVDGERVELFAVGSEDAYKPLIVNTQNPTQTLSKSFTADEHMHVRLPLQAGEHTITAAFVGRPAALSEVTTQPFLRSYIGGGGLSLPDVEWVTITGPFETQRRRRRTPRAGAGSSPAIRSRPSYELSCATGILGRLARLAYRRPPAARGDGGAARLLPARTRGRRLRERHRARVALPARESAVRVPLRVRARVWRRPRPRPRPATSSRSRTSTSPRGSRSSSGAASPTPSCSTRRRPDVCSDPDELRRQVRRMIADDRSSALVANFAGQWLYLRNLASAVPDPSSFPDFDDNLRRVDADRDRALLREHPARRPQRGRAPRPPTTRSSTSAWRATTEWPASTATASAASPSPTPTAAACSATPASSP